MDLVLLIEDEAVLRSSMARAIAKLPGVEVADVGTVSAALAIIDSRPPKMIVSDIDLPDRSGIELLGELGRRSMQIPILYVSGYLKAYGSQIPPHANVDVREKPVQLEELRSIVQSRLGYSTSSTEHAPFAVADYIQLACIGRHSVIIDVESEEENGRVIVFNGLVWTAIDSRGVGVDAFRRLAFARNSVTRVRTLREDPGEQTMFGSWESVLLNAARVEDEETRDSLVELSGDMDWFGGAEGMPTTARSPQNDETAPEPAPRVNVVDAPRPAMAEPVSDFARSAQKAVSGSHPEERDESTQQAPEPPQAPPSVPPVSRSGFVWRIDPTPAPEAVSTVVSASPAPAQEPAAASAGSDESGEDLVFNDAWDAGIAALLVKDYRGAFEAFKAAEAIRGDDPKVQANLKRLRELGYGEPAAGE